MNCLSIRTLTSLFEKNTQAWFKIHPETNSVHYPFSYLFYTSWKSFIKKIFDQQQSSLQRRKQLKNRESERLRTSQQRLRKLEDNGAKPLKFRGKFLAWNSMLKPPIKCKGKIKKFSDVQGLQKVDLSCTFFQKTMLFPMKELHQERGGCRIQKKKKKPDDIT